MAIDSKHPHYIEYEKDWEQIADCLAGQRRIKKRKTVYLPQPNSEDTTPENSARYDAYLKRAVFHNVTGRTVSNMVGQCFAIDPIFTGPEAMADWLEDIDGAGVSASQQAKKALAHVVAFSRAFLWVDYPRTNGVVSVAQAEQEGIRPRFQLATASQVLNWRVKLEGAKSKLSLVVIKEPFWREEKDGFELLEESQYRVLRLTDGKYIQEIHKPVSGGWEIETLNPVDGSGQPFNEIPGCFIGAESNNAELEKPLMLDISNLNIAHYRNSADYEEMNYMVGQPTPYITGLTDSWVEKQLKGGIMLGSRACIPLPEGGSAGLLQVASNTLLGEAMKQKEELMQALGARLVEKREVRQTATEAGINEASETSILASCCKNVSAAYAMAFRWAAQFANISIPETKDAVLYELNTDFAVARMSPEEAQGVLSIYQANLITFEEARDKLVSGGWAYLSDEDAKDQLEQQADEEFQKAKAELETQTNEAVRLQAAKQTPPGEKPGEPV
jgi:hypothetical protein